MRRTWAVRDLFISSSYLPGPLGLFFVFGAVFVKKASWLPRIIIFSHFFKKWGMRKGSSEKKLVVLFMLWSWRYWLLLVMRRFCWLFVFVLRFLIPWVVSVALQCLTWPLSGKQHERLRSTWFCYLSSSVLEWKLKKKLSESEIYWD